MFKALSIAGSDTSGGAGIQADLKTFQELGIYGMTALTVMVAQNPATGWGHDVYPIEPTTVAAQIDTVLGGIGVNALKTGMLPTAEIIAVVAEKLRQYAPKNIVIDPVMVCKGTDEVVNPAAADGIRSLLVPLADVITPNIFEAAALTGVKDILTLEGMKKAAAILHEQGAKNVFIKGGAKLGGETALDVFFDGKNFEVLASPLLATTYTHGAGCTTAAAVTASLAKGDAPLTAVRKAKEFVTRAIANGFALNQYVGATLHAAHRFCK